MTVAEPERALADKTPWKLGKTSEDRARICIRAAEERTKGRKYDAIAELLGLDSPMTAKRCAEVGYGLAPGDDLRLGRRKAADEIDLLRVKAWEVYDNPGYKVSGNGVIILDPATHEPMPDQEVRNQSLRLLTDLNKHYRTLLGTDAPRTSVIATAGVDEIRAQIEATRAELAREMRDRGIEDGDDGELPAIGFGL